MRNGGLGISTSLFGNVILELSIDRMSVLVEFRGLRALAKAGGFLSPGIAGWRQGTEAAGSYRRSSRGRLVDDDDHVCAGAAARKQGLLSVRARGPVVWRQGGRG